jgi:hypothetical protein
MIKPRHFRLFSSTTASQKCQVLPTGKSFGGSSLQVNLPEEWMLPIMSTSSMLMEENPQSTVTEKTSPLIVEVGKIFVLALWLWCLIGANFCTNSLNAIASFRTQNI